MTPSEISFDHGRIALHLGRAALRDLAAEIEHREPIADAHDQPHVVFDQQQGHAAIAQLRNHRHQRNRLRRIHTGRRLVEQQQLWRCRNGAGDLQQSALGIGQRIRRILGAREQADHIERGARRAGDARLDVAISLRPQHDIEKAAARALGRTDFHVLEHRQPIEQANVLERACKTFGGDPTWPQAHELGAIEHD